MSDCISCKSMSYLSNELQALLTQYGMLQVDIIKNSGINGAKASRICSGTQEFIRSRDLDKIIAGLTKVPQEQGRIVRARLLDAYDGRYASLVKIIIKGGAPVSSRFTPSDVSIDPEVNAAVADLYADIPGNPRLAKLILDLRDFHLAHQKRG